MNEGGEGINAGAAGAESAVIPTMKVFAMEPTCRPLLELLRCVMAIQAYY